MEVTKETKIYIGMSQSEAGKIYRFLEGNIDFGLYDESRQEEVEQMKTAESLKNKIGSEL